MSRAILQFIVLGALTSCATISGLADKEAVDCPGDCSSSGSLPPRSDDASTGVTDAGDANVVADTGPPKCDPTKDAACIALPAGWALVTRSLGLESAESATCSSGAKPITVQESPTVQSSACTCDVCTTTPATCSGQLTYTYSTGGACSVDGNADEYTNAVAGTCYQDLFKGVRTAFENRFVLPQPSGGSCSVTPTVHAGRVSYAVTSSLCDEASRCSGGFCDATIDARRELCVAHDGDTGCPEGFPTKHVVGTGGAEFDCGTCSCNVNRQPCQGDVNHYTDANCQNGLVAIPANGACGGPSTYGKSFDSYKVVATSQTTCNTGGSTTATNARMKNPRTVCCR
jgi:hypothetical protein